MSQRPRYYPVLTLLRLCSGTLLLRITLVDLVISSTRSIASTMLNYQKTFLHHPPIYSCCRLDDGNFERPDRSARMNSRGHWNRTHGWSESQELDKAPTPPDGIMLFYNLDGNPMIGTRGRAVTIHALTRDKDAPSECCQNATGFRSVDHVATASLPSTFALLAIHMFQGLIRRCTRECKIRYYGSRRTTGVFSSRRGWKGTVSTGRPPADSSSPTVSSRRNLSPSQSRRWQDRLRLI